MLPTVDTKSNLYEGNSRGLVLKSTLHPFPSIVLTESLQKKEQGSVCYITEKAEQTCLDKEQSVHT